MSLANKVCIITGATGSIGRAAAEAFYKEGCRLAITSQGPKVNEVAVELSAADRILPLQLDVSQWAEVQAVVENVRARWGTIDILVNSAGVLGAIGPTAEVSVEEWVRTVEVNLLGCFYLARAVVPVMRAQKEGVILNFSGGGAAYGRPYFTAYGASKAAVVRFTESLAEELRDCNIQVNAIAPGPVKSRMWDAVREAGDSAGVRALTELRDLEKGKWAPPERAAQLAVFLASGKCKGLSGRLVSAIYDKWETFESRVDEIMGSDALTLRRVPLK